MKKRLFNKNFNREHRKAHQDSSLKGTVLDLGAALREKELQTQEYKKALESEKKLRVAFSAEIDKDINDLIDTSRKQVKQAIMAGGLAGVAAGGLLGYLVRMYLG